MSFVIDHLEFLLQRHDCVVLPSLGAFMVRYRAAHFDSADSCLLLPPSRELAFNGALTESDGLLETSVARKCGVSFEAARRMITEEISALSAQLYQFGELHLGNLGILQTTEYGTLLFSPSASSNWDLRSYGLSALVLTPAEAPHVLQATTPYIPEEEEVHPKRHHGKAARGIIGIAASLAVFVTIALFLLYPIRLSESPVEASLAPTIELVHKPSTPVQPVPAQSEASSDDTPAVAPADSVAAVASPKAIAPAPKAADVSKAAVAAGKNAKSTHNTYSRNDSKSLRFDPSDNFYLIVASFPDEAQAKKYLAENPTHRLGILEKEGRFRIYAATGNTYEQTNSQKSLAGYSDSWVCRR